MSRRSWKVCSRPGLDSTLSGPGLIGEWPIFAFFIQGRLEHPQIGVAHDSSELRRDRVEGRHCLSNGHRSTLPALHATLSVAQGRVAVVDQVRHAEAATQLARKAQAGREVHQQVPPNRTCNGSA